LKVTSRTSLVVDDGTALGLLSGATGDDLAQAVRTLRAGGAVVTDALLVSGGKAILEANVYQESLQGDAPPPTDTFDVPGYVLTTAKPKHLTVLSPAAVQQAGFRSEPFGVAVATTRMPSQADEDALQAAVEALGAGYVAEIEHPLQHESLAFLVFAICAGFITLGAAAIATGLAAVDSRADLATLAAVGASPGLRRKLSLSQAGVIAGLGALLGALAGLGAGIAIVSAINRTNVDQWPPDPDYPITVPWPNLLITLVIVPAIAMLGAGLLTRSRLPIERRL
jgi:putative ABC transport system permease protein